MLDYISLFAGFAVNLLVALVIVRLIYYPANPNKNYVFTYLAFNTVIYFVMSFLTSAELSVGVGFWVVCHLLGVALPHQHHVHAGDDLPVYRDRAAGDELGADTVR